MAGLGSLEIKLLADIAQFTSDMGRASHVFESNVRKMQRGFENLRNAVVAATTAGGLAFFVKSALDTADQLNKLNQRTGLSVERLSELKFAAELSGVSIEDFATAMAKFNDSLVEGRDETSKIGMLYKALGVDIRSGPSKAFDEFTAKIAKLPDSEVKVAALREVFSRVGDKLIPFINSMNEGTEAARRLGVVMGGELARQAEQFNDNLKKLKGTSDALAIAFTSSLVGGLTTLSDNLVKAAEKGELLLGVWRELNKLVGALMGTLFGEGGPAGKAATQAFAEMERGVRGRIRGPDGKPIGGGGAVPDPQQLAAILSGNAKKAAEEAQRRAERLRQEDLKGWIAHAEEVFRASEEELNALAKINDEYWAHVEKMRQLDIQGWIAHAEEIFRLAEEEATALARIADDETKKASAAARELGLTFTSAFEDAVIAGKKLSDVLKGLAADIARIIFRKTVTEPLAGAVSSIASEFFKGLFKKSAVGGPISGPSIVGEHGPEVFVPQGFGSITPNHELAGAGAVNVNLTINAVDARSVAQLMGTREGQGVIVSTIERAFQKNGSRSGMAL